MPAPKKPASKILTWDEIEQAEDLVEEVVPCPEWGGGVKIRALSRARSVATLAECVDPETGVRDGGKLQMLLVLRGVIEPALSDDRYEQLNKKHPRPISRICDRVEEISGMNGQATQDAAARFPDQP